MKQKLDWQTSKTPKTGRVAQISDEGCGYWAALPDDMTLQDAVDAFGVGYDYNDYVGEISCDAQLVVDGAEVESLQFTLDSREEVSAAAAASATRQHNDNMTQSIEDCDDYTCPACGGTYTGGDWRERNGKLICPDCAEMSF